MYFTLLWGVGDSFRAIGQVGTGKSGQSVVGIGKSSINCLGMSDEIVKPCGFNAHHNFKTSSYKP